MRGSWIVALGIGVVAGLLFINQRPVPVSPPEIIVFDLRATFA